ncbi:MAG: pantoate--beta-alanine ligase [Deltaproteobacteria bacterium]|nr:pantoate--beta-alanine ligase [Deltaproteobacteria bacterium]
MTSPEVLRSPEALRARCDEARCRGLGVGFVPTMGALHEGHLALAREARGRVGDAGLVAVSVFVNPTQFGPHEDFSRYPRDLAADVARCAEASVDVVFAPAVEAMYPPGDQTRVRVGALSEPLCGPLRPGHFEGVATVVTRLFAVAMPCVAFFGRKDYQQWRVLERLARDLLLPVEVVGVGTVRDRDGLALSSRNRYLSPEDRARATAVPRALSLAVRAYARGERRTAALVGCARAPLDALTPRVDYVELRDADTLEALPEVLPEGRRAVLAVAVHHGGARLIDNVVLGEEGAPCAVDEP